MIGGRVEDMEIDKILTDYVLIKDFAFYLKNIKMLFIWSFFFIFAR